MSMFLFEALHASLIQAFVINGNPLFSFSFTDDAYKKIELLPHLRFLDFCGAQVVLHTNISSKHNYQIYQLTLIAI